MSWFTPKCPVGLDDKEWLEDSFIWLTEEFGATAFGEIVRPTGECFPDEYAADIPSLRRMLSRVCSFMNVNKDDVELRVFSTQSNEALHPLAAEEKGSSGACGLYRFFRGKHYISIDTNLLPNPTNLIATIAHELAHARLIGEGRIDPEYEDHELLTDLATIFFGFGIFTANSLFSFEQFTDLTVQGWRASRQGYINEEMAGYALALYAYQLGEDNPNWEKFLKGNVGPYFRSSLKFLVKTGETRIERLR